MAGVVSEVREYDEEYDEDDVIVLSDLLEPADEYDPKKKKRKHDEEHYHTVKIVGFQDEAHKIMEHLLGDSKKLDIVSIIGMPGLGKTTLAEKIYWDSSVSQCFDVQAWCFVSQTYQRRELLLTILRCTVYCDQIDNLSDEELAAKLWQTLKCRRYLIVIDDMWDIEAWYALQRSFPDDKNCSRILITSRLQNVVAQIEPGMVHALRQFNDDESWELFCKKLYQNESFSWEFLDIGKQIAKNCKGLPGAVVAIAEVLRNVPKQEWNIITGSVSSHIINASKEFNANLELSFNHLPNDLKSCFLYIAAFSEDQEIPVWKLKLLWTAEGFVQNTQGRSLGDEAEEYFEHLISSSLVIATKERSLGGVKACHLNDLWREFCLQKAKEESFLQVIRNGNWFTFPGVYDQPRLSIYSEEDNFTWGNAFVDGVHSLLYNVGYEDNFPSDPGQVSFNFQKFKLVKVLDLACIYVSNFSETVFLLDLRYLAIGARRTHIPASIANLENLQSFIFRANRLDYDGEVIDVPDSLWSMVNLKHVHINHYSSFDVQSDRLENSSILDTLETLAGPCLSYGQDAENLLRRLPRLRKLRCVLKGIKQGEESIEYCQFPILDFLDQLISLNVTFEGSLHSRMRCQFNLPSNLQKLTLSNFRLLWLEISEIGMMLPNLKVLKLIGADLDDTWIVNDGGFPKLTYLKLTRLTCLSDWIVSDDGFPKLEQLVLDKCSNLEKIPDCFGEIPTLRMIMVKDCTNSVADSARVIKEQQQNEWQNEGFKLYTYPQQA